MYQFISPLNNLEINNVATGERFKKPSGEKTQAQLKIPTAPERDESQKSKGWGARALNSAATPATC